MFHFSIESVILALFVSIAWMFGVQELIALTDNFAYSWPWYLAALAYTVSINEIFAHLICSHRMYPVNPKRFIYKAMAFLTSVDHGYGPLSNICINHARHHSHSDQGIKDNLSFPQHWYSVCSLSPLMYIYQTRCDYGDRNKYLERQMSVHAQILNDDWTVFCETYRILLTLMYWGVLLLLAPWFLFKIVFMGRVILSVITLLTTSLGHSRWAGYRLTKSNNSSVNLLVLHYIIGLGLFSSFLHNNHHNSLWLRSKKHSQQWYEFDAGALIARVLKLALR